MTVDERVERFIDDARAEIEDLKHSFKAVDTAVKIIKLAKTYGLTTFDQISEAFSSYRQQHPDEVVMEVPA